MNLSLQFKKLVKLLPSTKWWGEKWTVRILISLSGVLLLIMILSVSGSKTASSMEKWADVQARSFVIDLIESGDIEAVSHRPINAPMLRRSSNLQIIDIVPDGIMVNKGDFLIQFDVSELQTSLDLRKDQLESLRADLDKLEAQQALTISNQLRSIQLSNYSNDQALLRLEMRKFESEASREEARLEVKQAEIELNRVKKQNEAQKIIHESQLIKMRMSIREAENRLEEYQERIKEFTVNAPIDGMVVYQDVGSWNSRERLKNGYQARPGETLMAIPDLNHMEVKLYLNEVDRMKVEPGQVVEVRLDAYPEIKFPGIVRSVSRMAQPVAYESTVKGFQVFIDIGGSDPKLKPGMTAQARIILDSFEDVLVIPVGTIFEVDGQTVVFRKGRGKPIPVMLGSRNDAFVVVEGVKEGMKLSWFNPLEKSAILGTWEEKKRIVEVSRTIAESFGVFQDRGILYNYESETSGQEEQETQSKFDLNKLPPSLRNKLQKPGPSETAKPKIEVSTPEGKQKKGTFKVSPDMMKRLQEKKSDTNE
jgi:HlyD family secretion protein